MHGLILMYPNYDLYHVCWSEIHFRHWFSTHVSDVLESHLLKGYFAIQFLVAISRIFSWDYPFPCDITSYMKPMFKWYSSQRLSCWRLNSSLKIRKICSPRHNTVAWIWCCSANHHPYARRWCHHSGKNRSYFINVFYNPGLKLVATRFITTVYLYTYSAL